MIRRVAANEPSANKNSAQNLARCYINAQDFETLRALGEYLEFLARDDDAYNAYLA